MAKRVKRETKQAMRPATTPEMRENQMISLAVDLAEKQLRDGTASAQVIVHYLKLATQKSKLEEKILDRKAELMLAQTENLQSAKRIEELYENALTAMKLYGGAVDDAEDQELY